MPPVPAKQIPPYLSRSRSPIFLLTLSFLALSLLFIVFSSSHKYPDLKRPYTNLKTAPETSFVVSLEQFLTQTTPQSSSNGDDTVLIPREEDVRRLDDRKYEKEREGELTDPFYPLTMPLKVYVYQMPSKFTYDLLWLFRNTYKQTSNLTSNGSPVHRLIEQHSIDYWLWVDLIAPQSERQLKNVVRVHQKEEADLFYVPFFTTISFFLLEKQQCKALYRV